MTTLKELLKEPKLDRFHYHEALDRAYFICEVLELWMKHPVYAKHEDDLEVHYANAYEAVFRLYQEVGNIEPPKRKKKKAA